jgi:hypothetical protein
MKVFINGTLVIEKTSALITHTEASEYSQDKLYIGNLWNHEYPYRGKMDNVRIYNRAINSAEISYLYDLGSAGSQTLFEDFEGNVTGTIPSLWSIDRWGDAGLIRVVDNPVSDGNRAVKIQGSYAQGIYKPGSLQESNQDVSFDVYISSGNSAGQSPSYFMYAGINITFYATNSSQIEARVSHDSDIKIDGLSADTWQHFNLQIDWDNSIFTLTHGNRSIGPVPFTKNLSGGWSSDVSLYGNNSSNNNTGFYDNISISLKEDFDNTLISELSLTDSNLQQCIQSTAANNNWTYVYQVTALTCTGSGITSLDSISSLYNLTDLNLSNNQISDISSLSSLTGLVSLNLSGNPIDDCSLSPVANSGCTQKPQAPQNVSVIAGENKLTISWDVVDDATSYNVYYAEESFGDDIANYASNDGANMISGITDPEYLLEALNNATQYYSVVTAVNESIESEPGLEYSATPTALTLNDGLVAYYPFDGNANDVSGNGNHGIQNGGVTYIDGVGSQSVSFDGADDYIHLGEALLPIGLNDSFSVLLSFTADNLVAQQAIISQYAHGPGRLHLVQKSGNILWLFMGGSDSDHNQGIEYHLTSTDTIHVAIIKNDMNVALYVNGSYINSFITDVGIQNTQTLLGRDTNGGNSNFKGLIDDLRIYNRALSSSDVNELYSLQSSAINLESGLVAHYEFEGNAEDSSGNGNDGSEYGLPSYVTGIKGSAIELDGIDDYVEIQDNNNSLDLTNIKSACAWFNASYQNSTDSNAILSKYKSDTWNEDGYIVTVSTAGTVRSWIKDNSGNVSESTAISYEYGEWAHVCLVYKNDTAVQYVNGVQTGFSSGLIGSPTGSEMSFLIGAYFNEWGQVSNYSHFEGSIDDVRIYNRALNSAEISKLYNMPSSSSSPELTNNSLWTQLIDNARVGDILLFAPDQNCSENPDCYDNAAVSIAGFDLFSYGYYSHAALVTTVNRDLNKLVIFHAKGPEGQDEVQVEKDVIDNEWLEQYLASGSLKLARVKNVNAETASNIAASAFTKYDNYTYSDLTYSSNETYCSKLVRDAYADYGFYIGDQDKFDEGSILSQLLFTPDELALSNNIEHAASWFDNR